MANPVERLSFRILPEDIQSDPTASAIKRELLNRLPQQKTPAYNSISELKTRKVGPTF